ncbi:reverse transcriptase [Vairimorpha necatrix]|uniref:Reverse transcriptase n=1 Tax=Vairimorpha necatrix TaxID=6039 RepID=A0AAX4JAN2_9MICR
MKCITSFYTRKNLWTRKLQENFCIVNMQRIPVDCKDLRKCLVNRESELDSAIFTIRKFRRRNASLTKIVVEKTHKNLLIKIIKAEGYKVLNDNRKGLEKTNKTIKEIREKIKLLSLNINHLSHKREELEFLLKKEKPEIMCLQETWRQSNRSLRLEKYTAVETPSSGKNKPGLITLVRNTGAIRCSKKGTDSNILQTVVEFRSEGKWIKYLILNVYIPQDRDLKREVLARLLSLLEKEKFRNYYSEIIVMGDMNMQSSSLKKKLVVIGLPVTMKYNSKDGTRILKDGKRSKRKIDTIFRLKEYDNEKIIISKSWVLSDHLVLKKYISLTVDKISDQLVYDKKMLENPKVIKRLKMKLSNQQLSMNNLPEIIKKACTSLKIYKKKRVHTGLTMRWRYLKVFKEKRLAAKAVMKNHNEINLARLVDIKKRVEDTKKFIRKDRSKLWVLKGIKLFKSNRSREFWQWLKNRSVSIRLDQVTLIDHNKLLQTCRAKKLEIANKFYAELSSENDIDVNAYDKVDFFDLPPEITDEEFLSALKKCGNNKAAGPDEIPTELYKHLLTRAVEEKFFKFMLYEFNKYISGETLPKYWTRSISR